VAIGGYYQISVLSTYLLSGVSLIVSHTSAWHSDDLGIDRKTRMQREWDGRCPICGESYDQSRHVKNETTDDDWSMLGIAYVHGNTECIEWASGEKVRYDTADERIIQ